MALFAEIVKSPEYMHTYRVTPLSLWNASAAGVSPEDVLATLKDFSRYEVPHGVVGVVRDLCSRFGRLRIEKGRDLEDLYLTSDDQKLLSDITTRPQLAPFFTGKMEGSRCAIDARRRGHLKQALVGLGYPSLDLAGYAPGEPLEINLRSETLSGSPFTLRHYQTDATAGFVASGSERGGSGVVVLPCGAGKTLVGIGAMATLKTSTLILCPNNTGVHQWVREIVERTSLRADQVGIYNGEAKEIRPVTVSTYNMLSQRGKEGQEFPHFSLFWRRPWGLIIYDEVHLLPAPVFRITAELQSVRRLGLTATLVREDGREEEVFALVGPKRYDVPWKELERQGWIAPAECHEFRVAMPDDVQKSYSLASPRERYPICAKNPVKSDLVQTLLAQHENDRVLIIGQYLDQLKALAGKIAAPLITGATSQNVRERLYEEFRRGTLRRLVVSKVANFALDLPEANVTIQISGTFGSRQEEAQRLGRILRPKVEGGKATFYSVVSKGTVDQEFALQRQLFLVEQGYRYTIVDLAPDPVGNVGLSTQEVQGS